jgi:hypothetical protein
VVEGEAVAATKHPESHEWFSIIMTLDSGQHIGPRGFGRNGSDAGVRSVFLPRTASASFMRGSCSENPVGGPSFSERGDVRTRLPIVHKSAIIAVKCIMTMFSVVTKVRCVFLPNGQVYIF